jgi:hypothetical protein
MGRYISGSSEVMSGLVMGMDTLVLVMTCFRLRAVTAECHDCAFMALVNA